MKTEKNNKNTEICKLFHGKEESFYGVPGVRAMSDGADPEYFHTSEQHDK